MERVESSLNSMISSELSLGSETCLDVGFSIFLVLSRVDFIVVLFC